MEREYRRGRSSPRRWTSTRTSERKKNGAFPTGFCLSISIEKGGPCGPPFDIILTSLFRHSWPLFAVIRRYSFSGWPLSASLFFGVSAFFMCRYCRDNKNRASVETEALCRRRRDSNPRTAFDGYTISNRARSTSYATSPSFFFIHFPQKTF